jgi:hypothetical protein
VRVRYLKLNTLRKLVNNVRNIKIYKLSKVTCKYYIKIYTKQVILRQVTKRKSLRLF